MARVSIGWVAVSKFRRNDRLTFGGHKARCKVYATRGMAVAAQRGAYKTDDYVNATWDFVEAFVDLPDPKEGGAS